MTAGEAAGIADKPVDASRSIETIPPKARPVDPRSLVTIPRQAGGFQDVSRSKRLWGR